MSDKETQAALSPPSRIVPVEVAITHRPRTTGVSSMKLVRGALHRLLFVTYIALRQLLLKLGILTRPQA